MMCAKMGGTALKMTATRGAFPTVHLATLQGDELDAVPALCARSDTALLLVEDCVTGALLAYGVIGLDNSQMFTIYAARSHMTGLGGAAIKGLFGASQILGTPLRVHSEKVRTYAKMMGAGDALETLDSDGVAMGIFSDG